MSVPFQSRVFTTPNTPPHDTDASVLHSRLPWDSFYTLNSPMLAPTTYFHQSPIGEHLIRLGTNPWSFHNPCLWHANQVYGINTALSTSPLVNLQTRDNLSLWGLVDGQVVPESFPSLPLPTMVNGMRRDDMIHETSDTLGAPNDQNSAEPFVPRRVPSHQSFSPSSLHWFPHHSRSTEPPEPDTRFRFVTVPPQVPTIPSCRTRGARAFEFGGVWLDEEELVKGLMHVSGRLDVFQCHWEENDSPCYLWIKGNKSCINLHIQRWHGGQPGGDKLEAECRWSGCEATMLKESIARHIVSIHLGEKWECQGCGKETARYDVHRRHAVRSNLEACQISGALTTYSADARVIDARAALDSGRGLRADA